MFRVLTLAATALAVSAAVAQAEDLEFMLGNETSVDLVEFNVSIAESNNWEENLLEGGYLPTGNEIGVLIADGEDTCVYDIRGVFSDDTSFEEYGLDLCDMGGYTFTEE